MHFFVLSILQSTENAGTTYSSIRPNNKNALLLTCCISSTGNDQISTWHTLSPHCYLYQARIHIPSHQIHRPYQGYLP